MAESEARAKAHEHVFLGARHDEHARRTAWVVALSALMMVGEIVAGKLFHSMALLADGFHMATHAGALAISALAYAFARKHAHNPRFSFGTGKVSDLAGFASALSLALVAIAIAYESATRFFEPSAVAFGEATLVAGLGLVVNIVSALLLAGGSHDHDHHGHDHHDHNLRSAFVHVAADTLTSVLAIVALLAGRYGGIRWLDPAMGLVGAAVIAVWSYDLLRRTAEVLLDTSDPELEAEVRSVLASDAEQVTDLHLWRVGPGSHAAIVGLTGTADCSDVRRRLASVHELVHITVEKV